MSGRRLLGGLLVVVCFILYPTLALTNSQNGAPPEHTGAPTPTGVERTCATTGCHVGSPLNSAPGALVIEAPTTFSSGETVEFTVRVSHPSRSRFGFEVAVKDESHEHVGELLPIPTEDIFKRTVAPQGNANYLSHYRASASGEWTMRWKAPDAAVGDVIIYAAGNASDGDFQNDADDLIYTTRDTIRLAATVGTEPVPQPTSFTLHAPYPNPFYSTTAIPYALREATPVTLTVYDVQGRIVHRRDLGFRAAGDHVEALGGSGWPAGVYVYELRTPTMRQARQVLLVK